jgi:antitoxin component YwqK of YwqJK toxin-antitoxin module
MKIIYFITILLITNFSFAQKEYIKTYHQNGKLNQEGWMQNNMKTGYWFYYDENGNKKAEGHYTENRKDKWWIFYDSKQVLLKKCEYKNNNLDGLAIIYKSGKISCVEQYIEGKKIKTWHSISAFKKDNPLIR